MTKNILFVMAGALAVTACTATSTTTVSSPIPDGETVRMVAKHGAYPSGAKHDGIDLAGPEGWNVQAICDGDVKLDLSDKYADTNAQGVKGSTNHLRLDCEDVEVSYGHFFSADLASDVYTGATVKAGQTLFKQGNQGNSTGPHVSIAVTKDGQSIDPAAWLADRGVTLPEPTY